METVQTSKKLERAQWLRAAILGANDGLLSTTSLMLGVGAAKHQDQSSMLLSGVAGALAGACSMAVGEFVSVSTQRDIAKSFADNREGRLEDGGYKTKIQTVFSTPGRSPMTKVMETDHAKRSLEENDGEEPLPNPLKAAAASSLAFLCGSFVPIMAAVVVRENRTRICVMVIAASLALSLFGGIGAFVGGSSVKISAVRVLVGGWVSMAVTYGLLKPFDKDVDK